MVFYKIILGLDTLITFSRIELCVSVGVEIIITSGCNISNANPVVSNVGTP